MPIYEYECSACAEVSEELRTIADRNNPIICKRCGAVAHLMFSPFRLRDYLSTGRQEANLNQEPSSGGIQIENCNIENCNVGISIPKGTNIKMTENRFKNVKKPIEFRDKK